MSIECNNTAPLASRFSELTDVNNIGDIDFTPLISRPDPLDNIDRASVKSITDGMNEILTDIDLGAYPTLASRRGQFPLLYAEVADYLITNNIDPVDVQIAVESYNGGELNNLVAKTVDDLDLYYNDNYAKSIAEGTCGKFGSTITELLATFSLLDATLDKLTDLKNIEWNLKKEAIKKTQEQLLEEFADKLTEIIDKLFEKVIKKILDGMEGLGKELVKLITDPKNTISGYMDKITEEATDFYNGDTMTRIKNNVSKFITGMIAMFERPTIANIQMILHILCNFVEVLLGIIFSPAEEFNKIVNAITGESQALSCSSKNEYKIAVEAGAVRISEEAGDTIRQSCTAVINEKALDNSVNRYLEEVILIMPPPMPPRVKYVVKYRQPGELGYIDPATQQLAIPENVDYIHEEGVTDDERKAIDELYKKKDMFLGRKIDRTYIGPTELIKFSDKVIEDQQWKGVKQGVWSKLLRMSALTGERFELREGRVAPDVEVLNARARRFGKKQGTVDAYHKKYSGYAVELNVTDENRQKAILAASRVGFTGIHVGKTYIKLDLGTRSGSVSDGNDPRWDGDEALAGTDLIRVQSMMKKHLIDGYRKRREGFDDFNMTDPSTFVVEEDNTGESIFVENTNPFISPNPNNVVEENDPPPPPFEYTPTF